ncbi:RNA polymerase sigma factor [Desertivirga arenae]|uniref:RNA polymerase sigma factor n=1 Tax=Desertivirga arenae TaxID=2810309 RepID=UPI001A9798D7|nr:sigma-70 family RNA polymerase sigma factor [Pedobacter sp. SYSU D00823]
MGENLRHTWGKFISGDQEALMELYRQHYLGLINYGMKFTQDRELANEYIIKVLSELWETRTQLPEVNNPRSYLLTCLRREIQRHFKAEDLRKIKEGMAAGSNSDQLTYNDYFERVQENAVLRESLFKLMEKLTARQKELLTMKFFRDMSYDEIAEELGISKRTAYNIINEAIKTMRAQISPKNNQNLSHFISTLAIFCTLFNEF